jgi:hypothetical protein
MNEWLNEACVTLKKAALHVGLTINQEKPKFMEVSSNTTKEKHIIIDNKNIKK